MPAPVKILYETVGKLAGINVIFDPDYTQGEATGKRPLSIELNSTLEDALDYLATISRTFWKSALAERHLRRGR
jgi:general secretion pathway protein D